jgi:hypothetical protein
VLAKADYKSISASRLVELRNSVDSLEKSAESARQRFGEAIFARINSIDLTHWRRAINDLATAARAADRKQQSFFRRCLWALSRTRRLDALAKATNSIMKFATAARRAVPTISPLDERRVNSFISLALDLNADVEAAQKATDYLNALQQLGTMPDPATIAAYRVRILEKNRRKFRRIMALLAPHPAL